MSIYQLFLTLILIHAAFAEINGRCSSGNGVCVTTANCSKAGGTYKSGLCPNDRNDVKCCNKSCTVNGKSGECKFTSNCSGTSYSGVCPGGKNFQCCITTPPNKKKINKAGLDLIKRFEGLRLTAYCPTRCPPDRLTIGYGSTSNVKAGMKITEKEAEERLKKDVAWAEDAVNKYQAKYNFNDNQFSALVSFAFNIGSIDQLTNNGKRTIAQIKAKIPEYNKSGGKVYQGLVDRRKAELQLFNK